MQTQTSELKQLYKLYHTKVIQNLNYRKVRIEQTQTVINPKCW